MARAFAPGHVSGLFAVHDEAVKPLAKGSRGAGWSLELGARALVEHSERNTLKIGGQPAEAPVTRRALQLLAPDVPLAVELTLELPTGQGFGMSAAGSLAACLAAATELDLEPELALSATHQAEVEAGTGLGDAVGSWFGSGEVRLRPGCPPTGWALRIEPPAGTRFLFVGMGATIATPRIIRDEAWARRTRDLGDAAVDRILAIGRSQAWTAILEESQRFSLDLGLLTPAMKQLGASLPDALQWGQAMLGHTLWVTGPAKALAAAQPILAAQGPVVACAVDENGARVLRS